MYAYERERLRQKDPYYLGRSLDDVTAPTHDKRYVALLGSMSHSYGNALAFMQNYLINLFPKDLFKTIHVNSKIAHRQIRSTGYEYTKKLKPMIIFRPRIADEQEDRFLKGTAFTERMVDIHQTWGMGNLFPFMNDPTKDIEVKFQLNRSVLYVDVIMIFATLMQQIDYVHYFQNAARLNHPFTLETSFESYIPQDMLKIISDIVGIPMYNARGETYEFLRWLNGNSVYPITYKLQGSTGTREFYRYYPVNVDTIITDLGWDDGEQAGQVKTQYQISFSVRMEFNSTGFYYIFSDRLFGDYHNLPITYPEDSSIIPVFTDVILKEDLNLKPGWRLYNSATYRLESQEDEVCIDELMNDSIRKVVEYHRRNGLGYFEFLDVKVRKQGEILRAGIDYDFDIDTMTIKFKKSDVYYTYKFLVCINVEYINNYIKEILKLK